MTPAAGVSGLYLGHPQLALLRGGQDRPDQLEDYSARIGVPVEEAARRLGPSIAPDR